MAYELPLFPLRAVLFPGGLLSLKVFEARYLDLIAQCLRERRSFGVVGLSSGSEVRDAGGKVQLETIGCEAELLEVNGDTPGILQVRCKGTRRFETHDSSQQDNGLWVGQVTALAADADLPYPSACAPTAVSLGLAIARLKGQGVTPILEPYRYDDPGWVANRWCELLPLSQQARQKLMELPDPVVRLQLVDEFLRSKGILG
ncbi:MAG: peptidase S16 [Aquabacterium sp.]|nr:MAG: peptidase S16 [Aquabacterium sp.]